MPPRRRGFFSDEARPEDELARQREVEALIAPRRTVLQDVPLGRLRPNPFQARTSFAGIDELAAAISAQGFTSRLRARPAPGADGYFQLVYGERRLRAAAAAGLAAVPVEIAEHSDAEMVEIGLAENIQRRDLEPLEEAAAFAGLIRAGGYSVRGLAERIGKDKSYIEDRLKLLAVPDDVRAMVERRPESLRAAREIAKLGSPAERAPLIAGVVDGSLSTAAVRGAVRERAAEPGLPPGAARRVAADLRDLLAVAEGWERLLDQPGGAELVGPALGRAIAAFEHLAASLRESRDA